jgi:hypothetical protein
MQKVYAAKRQIIENAGGELNHLFNQLQRLNEMNEGQSQWKSSY